MFLQKRLIFFNNISLFFKKIPICIIVKNHFCYHIINMRKIILITLLFIIPIMGFSKEISEKESFYTLEESKKENSNDSLDSIKPGNNSIDSFKNIINNKLIEPINGVVQFKSSHFNLILFKSRF